MLRKRSFRVARGVGGWSKNCFNDVVSDIKYMRDKANQNMTRDFVIGNDYDNSEAELSYTNQHKDDALIKNNSGQIGSGIRKQALFNLKRKIHENNSRSSGSSSSSSKTSSCANGCSSRSSNNTVNSCKKGCREKKSKSEPKRVKKESTITSKSETMQRKRKQKKEEEKQEKHKRNRSKSLKFDTSVYCKQRHRDNFAKDIFQTL